MTQPRRESGAVRARLCGNCLLYTSSAGIDYKTGKSRRTSTCCNTRQEAIAILQQQAHEVRTQGWRDPMSVTLGEWYEYWLDTYMKDTVKQSTYASYRSYLNKHFWGYEFTDLTGGTLNIRLQQFDAGYEYFTISAMDNAGNMSEVYKTVDFSIRV